MKKLAEAIAEAETPKEPTPDQMVMLYLWRAMQVGGIVSPFVVKGWVFTVRENYWPVAFRFEAPQTKESA